MDIQQSIAGEGERRDEVVVRRVVRCERREIQKGATHCELLVHTLPQRGDQRMHPLRESLISQARIEQENAAAGRHGQ
jgi:hypothetical protein